MVDPNWVRQVLHQNPHWAKMATYKEVPIIAELLMPGDQILDVAFGLYEDHLGLVVVTPTKVLFGGRKAASLLQHTKSEVFELQRITSVQVNASALLSTLVIVTSGAKGEIKSMATPECKRIADGIRYLLDQRNAAPPMQPPPAVIPPPISLTDELRKLADLRAAGFISDQEFAQAKAKLLS
ncbi:MAG: SHOCT domain-containing protein [Armatimonadetes bacterium]|nr:SHOCT domain-containing protein [Armatimonadota bacterium]